MIINDLSHIEVANQAQDIQGGDSKRPRKTISAFADAESKAFAVGDNFAATEIYTFTKTSTDGYASSASSGFSSSVSNSSK